MKIIKLPIVMLLCVLLSACGNSDSKTKDSKTSAKAKPLSYIIDDFLVYDSHEELKANFKYLSTGEKTTGNIKSVHSTVNMHPEDSKFFIAFKWKDQENYKDLEYLEISNNRTIKWKTKSGISPNLTLDDYKALNKKPFKINKFDIYNEATIDWNGGDLANSNITIKIKHPEGFLPRALSKLRRETSMSNDAEIQDANFKVTTFMYSK